MRTQLGPMAAADRCTGKKLGTILGSTLCTALAFNCVNEACVADDEGETVSDAWVEERT